MPHSYPFIHLFSPGLLGTCQAGTITDTRRVSSPDPGTCGYTLGLVFYRVLLGHPPAQAAPAAENSLGPKGPAYPEPISPIQVPRIPCLNSQPTSWLCRPLPWLHVWGAWCHQWQGSAVSYGLCGPQTCWLRINARDLIWIKRSCWSDCFISKFPFRHTNTHKHTHIHRSEHAHIHKHTHTCMHTNT